MEYGAGFTATQLPAVALGQEVARRTSPTSLREPIEPTFTESIRLVLEHALPTGAVGLQRTAQLAGVTPRTLQRWLKHDGIAFEDILDDQRRDKAVRMLAEPTATIARIAARLGCADPSNFTRAFRRWTGAAPSEFRAQGIGLPEVPAP